MVLFDSCNPNVGKSMLSLHVAVALKRYFKKKILYIDADKKMSATRIFSCMYKKNLLCNGGQVESMMFGEWEKNIIQLPSNIDFISVNLKMFSDEMQKKKIQPIEGDLYKLKTDYDYIFVNIPREKYFFKKFYLNTTNHIVYVATPKQDFLAESIAWENEVYNLGKKNLGIIFNKTKKENIDQYLTDKIEKFLGKDMIWKTVINENINIFRLDNQNELLFPANINEPQKNICIRTIRPFLKLCDEFETKIKNLHPLEDIWKGNDKQISP